MRGTFPGTNPKHIRDKVALLVRAGRLAAQVPPGDTRRYAGEEVEHILPGGAGLVLNFLNDDLKMVL